MEGDSSTEVISLSDWMHESTMFNIITNIQFYKNYAITKIFNIWKQNVRYNIFCKTRNKLVHENFIAKPAFANHLMDMNQMMYELQLAKTLSNNIQMSKTWEIDDFKGDQKRARNDATRHYDVIVERVIGKLDQVCKEVVERTNQNNAQDNEEARFGQQVKQKPMNEVRKEAEENAYLLALAEKDKGRLKSFIRLVDYLSIETLVQTNFVSMNMLIEEMKKERKQGLFNTTVNFEVQMFTPDQREISESLLTLLDDMIVVMRNTVRVITHPTLEQYVKSVSPMETISDIQKIILSSVEYLAIRNEIAEKVSTDFLSAETYVMENFEKCRPIYDFLNTWN
jgi:dynein heavy chain, axonemal